MQVLKLLVLQLLVQVVLQQLVEPGQLADPEQLFAEPEQLLPEPSEEHLLLLSLFVCLCVCPFLVAIVCPAA